MKYLILQNTTAPYRTSLFNKLYNMGVDLKLFYMCELEKERSWKVNHSDFHFPYYIDKGKDFYLKGFTNHWNPRILKMMRDEKNSVFVLGGSWNAFDVIAICFLKRLGLIKQELVFWAEANYLTIGARKNNGLRDALRSFVYNSGDGRIIVPGKMAEISFEKWGINNKRFIRLPNVIDEEVINPKSVHNRSFTPLSELPRFIMPVRLNERIKGIINFFNAIGPLNVKSAIFDILGDGEDEEMIRSFVKEHGFESHIFLHGFCDMETVNWYYMQSDVMVLPSFSDPSPLSLVEACCKRLPILASNRCGNHFETVEEGENGYVFNPDDHQAIKKVFEKLMLRRHEWKEMGEHSGRLFELNFQQDVVLPRFVAALESE